MESQAQNPEFRINPENFTHALRVKYHMSTPGLILKISLTC